MKTLKGKLEFISFWHPIKLETKNGEIDLRDEYFQVFKNLNGKPAKMKGKMNSLTVLGDKKSEYLLKFEKNDTKDTISILLEKRNGFGMSNLGSYVPNMLQRLNGMQVILKITKNSINVAYDPDYEVFELNYTRNNSCKIPDDKVKEICKIGEDGCCIFCTVGSNGFECQKFDSYMARNLLDRYAEGTMRANRIGNCKVIGRIEEPIIYKDTL
jgi:hypothetical protein